MTILGCKLSPRLQQAIMDEVEFCGLCIDAGVTVTRHAVILGVDRNWQVPLPKEADDTVPAWAVVQGAMIRTLAIEFVLTLPDDESGSVLVYAVGRDHDQGITMPLDPPHSLARTRGVRNIELGANLRTWIPARSYSLSEREQAGMEACYTPGAPWGLVPIGGNQFAQEGRA